MKLEFYNLQRQPFGVTPDPEYLYFAASHQRAFSALLSSVRERRGFSALIAKPGMGKTSLLFKLLELLKNSARTGFLFQTHGDSREVFSTLLHDLEADPAGEDWPSMQQSLNAALMRESAANRQVVVVIDEAQNLTDDAFESLRLLSNFEKPDAKLLHFVLAGQPPLALKLNSAGLVQLRQRLSVVVELSPFTFEQTASYIHHRLKVAGYRGQPLFTRDALEFIAQASEGIPRVINHLCFHSLAIGSSARRAVLDLATVHEAARALELERGQYGVYGLQAPRNERAVSVENLVREGPYWTAPMDEAAINSFNPVYRPRRKGFSVFRIGSAAFACTVFSFAIYLAFGRGMSPQEISSWLQTRVSEKSGAASDRPQPGLAPVPNQPPAAEAARPADQSSDRATADDKVGQDPTTSDHSEIGEMSKPSSPTPMMDPQKRVQKGPKNTGMKRKTQRNLGSAYPRQSTVLVSRTESLFQFALEKYGNADWATVRSIRAVNPQLRDPYQVLQRGQLIRLPAAPTVKD